MKCYPGDSRASPDTYPGNTQRYQGTLQGLQGGLQGGFQSYQAGRPSSGQSLSASPNCYVVPHATVENGVECKKDGDCPDKRCRPFPDGNRYCVSGQKSCTLPGGDGVPGGAVIGLHQQCYECAAGVGWKLCGEAGKQALQSNTEGVVVRQPQDESGRADWRYRTPTATGPVTPGKP